MRVVVTRAVAQSRDLIESIEAAGGVVVGAPMLEILPPADGGAAVASAVDALGSADWLAVLSPNGASSVVSAGAAPGEYRVAVVGAATGVPLAHAGWTIDVEADESTAHGLADELTAGHRPAYCLIVQAERGRPDLAERLRSAGWRVDTVIGYRSAALELDATTIEDARSADVVAFASPSAVERYVTTVGAQPSLAACIGPTTQAAAKGAGFTTVTAVEPTIPALLDAIVAAVSG